MLNLTTLVFLPLVGALLVAATPSKAVGLQRAITLLVTLVTAWIGIALCLDFDGSTAASELNGSEIVVSANAFGTPAESAIPSVAMPEPPFTRSESTCP